MIKVKKQRTHQTFNAINNKSQEKNPVFEQKRQEILDKLKSKQSFRVSVGKSRWVEYEEFDPKYNLREILNDEIVIEFDTEDKEKALIGIHETGINLYGNNIKFEIWCHGGKSPHLHIHGLPISHLDKQQRALWKKIFIRKYVPREYLNVVDISLTGVHLVALEWAFHWKGKYDIKKPLCEFNPIKDKGLEQ